MSTRRYSFNQPPFTPISTVPSKTNISTNLHQKPLWPILSRWTKLCQHQATSTTQLLTHQIFSIPNFKFWAQSYLDFADIRNLQKKPLTYTFSEEAVDLQTLSSHQIPTCQLYTFGDFIQFITNSSTSFGVSLASPLSLVKPWFWRSPYLQKRQSRKSSEHSLTESCYVTITIDGVTQENIWHFFLLIFLFGLLTDWLIDWLIVRWLTSLVKTCFHTCPRS